MAKRGRGKGGAISAGMVILLAVFLYSQWPWFHQKVDQLQDKAGSVSPSQAVSALGSVAQRGTSAAGQVSIPGGLTGAQTSTAPAVSTVGSLPPRTGTPSQPAVGAPGKGPDTGSASVTLAGLVVKGKGPMTGYDRVGDFGPAWTDDNDNPLGHNGCPTRDDILGRDMIGETFTSGHCVVATGTLADPYTGRVIAFVRGARTSSAVQVDHVVALGNVFVSGGPQLTARQRVNIANDPLNLLAVDGPANEAKADANAAEWLPPNKSFRCSYVARQIAVKSKYRLAVTQPEKDAMARVLTGCPAQGIPTE